jgi:hypothetical protein
MFRQAFTQGLVRSNGRRQLTRDLAIASCVLGVTLTSVSCHSHRDRLSRNWAEARLVISAARSSSTEGIPDLLLTFTNQGQNTVRVPERHSSFPGEVVISCREHTYLLRNRSLMYAETFGSPFYETELLKPGMRFTMRLRLHEDFLTEQDFRDEVNARARGTIDEFKPTWLFRMAACENCRALVRDRMRGRASNGISLSRRNAGEN